MLEFDLAGHQLLPSLSSERTDDEPQNHHYDIAHSEAEEYRNQLAITFTAAEFRNGGFRQPSEKYREPQRMHWIRKAHQVADRVKRKPQEMAACEHHQVGEQATKAEP